MSSMFDFNGAEPPRGQGLIEAGTPAMVVMTLRPGGHGEGNWLKASKDGSCLMLDAEFVIDGGPHNKRKFWGLFVVEGETDGQKTAADISRGRLRGILESARGITPSDESADAMAARRIAGWGDLDGLRFPCRIGIEKGKAKNDGSGESYADKNVLDAAITPDDPEYVSPGKQQASGRASAPPAANSGGSKAPAASKPSWAA